MAPIMTMFAPFGWPTSSAIWLQCTLTTLMSSRTFVSSVIMSAFTRMVPPGFTMVTNFLKDGVFMASTRSGRCWPGLYILLIQMAIGLTLGSLLGSLLL